MKNNLIIGGVIAVLLIGAAVIFVPKRDRGPVVVEPYQSLSEPEKAIYTEAKKFEDEGNLVSARDTYKKLIEQYPQNSMVNDIKVKIDELNMNILFSPTLTADSVMYEVQPGDSLYKIAKQNVTTVELIMRSNGLKDTLIKPTMKLKVSTAKYSILVDKSQNILMLKSNDGILRTYSVSTGADNSTPSGAYKIKNKLTDPTWYTAGAAVAAGSPENILGSRWLGFDIAGYGIHGTTDDASIGSSVTKGCVRMKNADVEELYIIVPAGTEVSIID